MPKSGVLVFYREQSPIEPAKVLLLLHGFPASSHQYRNLIPLLASKHRVIAPDLPGFGFTEAPSTFKHTFETLTDTVAEFLNALSISNISFSVFEYGAPVGFRLELSRPESIEAIISQNGNAYTEGFGDVWGSFKEFWVSQNRSEDRSELAEAILNLQITKFQYENGTPRIKLITPAAYYLDYALLKRPSNK